MAADIQNYTFGSLAQSDKVHPGCAVSQAVRRWLPTAAARVRVRAAWEVCGGQSGTGADFLRVVPDSEILH
jgi:hypothetical protein